MNLQRLRDPDSQQAITEWHAWLHHENQRGDRARLRRCDSRDEIMLQPAYYRLCRQGALRKQPPEALALVAGILAWVENRDERPTARLLGNPRDPGGDTPVFSELRFQRLLASNTPEDLFQNLRRAVMQLNKTADPVQLADETLHWQAQRQWPDSYTGVHQWQYRLARAYYEPQSLNNA
ncbi:type I-E CRISPR-associated protein Cse2/CasB [Thiolapillus brandeum]|uniref:CRISPR-associated protein CSE2 family n=1 Tax=Thiolapillus brandeum TaxID=1076588 RepID=A0A7U6JHF3_9GAMM|nr:type I-E CRISPR-associated protein Cse2/CasB [Thiolapillus brandeum]BAO44424.1 CRISPR-associated protein CSE2 family [Thiolapillus brandeum]